MSYGKLFPEMETTLREVIQDQDVFDLGAGKFVDLSRRLLMLGAKTATAVEKELFWFHKDVLPPGLRLVRSYFHEWAPPEEFRDGVAFISWPANYRSQVTKLLQDHPPKVIIYLGSNFDGTTCGTPEFFKHLMTRELLHHHPNPRNSMIIVGDPLPEGEEREPTYEEWAALMGEIQRYRYEEG